MWMCMISPNVKTTSRCNKVRRMTLPIQSVYKSVSPLTYDEEDRLTGYATDMSAGYTSDGLRAWKQVGTTTTYYIYSGSTPICEVNGTTGAITAVNTFGPTGLLARREGSQDIFYTFDPQGNVVQTLDSTGGVTATALYDAYGTKLSAGTLAPFGFGAESGYYTDSETGLLLLTYRYYDPEEGRFLTRDPIGYGGGMNLYGYCSNSPVGATDELGLYPLEGFREGFKKYADRLASHAPAIGAGLKEKINNKLASNPFGVALATTANSIIDLAGAADPRSLLRLPSAVAHYGEGFGAFAGDPSLENLGGAGQDLAMTATLAIGAAGALGSGGPQWQLGGFKSPTKWANQMESRGWTASQITEAIRNGERFPAENFVNKGNSATRYVHPETGRSVVVDNITHEALQVGGDNFRW